MRYLRRHVVLCGPTIERLGQLPARRDGQLGVDVGEMLFDGPQRHEQRLGDLRVAQSLTGHAGDAQLASGERVTSAKRVAAGAAPCDPQLGAGPIGKRVTAEAMG